VKRGSRERGAKAGALFENSKVRSQTIPTKVEKMTSSDSYQQLDDSARRAVIRRAVLRPIATAVVLTTGYFVVPMDDVADLGSVVLLVATLVVVVLVCIWQVHRVVRADYPALQAGEALGAVISVYLIGFAAGYYLLAERHSGDFSESLTRVGSLYFTLSVFSTVGFGDITASTDLARAIVSVQMVCNVLFVALGGRLLVAAVRRGQARKARG